jgi:hypothetical protein
MAFYKTAKTLRANGLHRKLAVTEGLTIALLSA